MALFLMAMQAKYLHETIDSLTFQCLLLLFPITLFAP